MKKYFTMILAIFLAMGVLIGGAKQSPLPQQNGSEKDSFCEEDVQKLLALQFDGYEDMTISNYRSRVAKLTDTAEYRDLLERVFKSETLYELKDTDELAAFLFYVLEPLTAEKWKSRDYSGCVTSGFSYLEDNAMLEYDFTMTVLNPDTLTIREYNTTRLSVISGIQDIMRTKTKEELQETNANSMRLALSTDIENFMKQLQTEKIDISIEFAYFPLSVQSSNGGNKVSDWDDLSVENKPSDGNGSSVENKPSDGNNSSDGNDSSDRNEPSDGKDSSERNEPFDGNDLSDRNGPSDEHDQPRENDEPETRRYSNGTREDYRSLLSLKTSNYQKMPLADFNNALLEWTNKNPERMERISEDTGWNDFGVDLSDEELSFVRLTVFLSGVENGKAIQSIYAGQLNHPSYSEELPQKTTNENGAWCSLYYQFFYSISNTETVKVGERDRQIEGMINAVHAFWDDTDIESMLKMEKSDIVAELQKIAARYSTRNIIITTSEGQVHFEHMDERNMWME